MHAFVKTSWNLTDKPNTRLTFKFNPIIEIASPIKKKNSTYHILIS